MNKNKHKMINMLNDAMFKSIIRSKEARPLVNNFLHSLTHVEEEKLEKATYMGGEIAKKHIHEKGKSSDIIITVEDCKIILEMNQTDTLDIFDKNTSYAFALSTISTHISEKRKKVILINFDGFNRFKTDEPILVFRLQDEHGHIESELYLSFHLILENAKKSQYNIAKEVEEFMDFFTKYESIEELKDIVTMTQITMAETASTIIDGETILEMRELAKTVPLIDDVLTYAMHLVTATHPEIEGNEIAKKYIRYGASPRACQAVITASKVKALMDGNYNVSYDDIDNLIYPVLRHRIKLSYNAINDHLSIDDVIGLLIKDLRKLRK